MSRAAGGSAPRLAWEQAWQEALYGAGGFYRRHAPAEHFATSVQGVPGAGAVVAEAVVALARRHGCTRVFDVGAGGGELLAHVRALAPDLHLTGVDVVDRRSDGVDAWLLSPGGAALPETLTRLVDTLVVAHEWLDVVPCPVVGRDDDGVWRTLTVSTDGTEAPGDPVDGDDLAWLGRWVPDAVARAEVGLPRDRAAGDLFRRVDRGALLVVDYAHRRSSRPTDGTLTGLRGGRQVRPVPDGSCDLTAHVAVDSLVEHLRTDGGATTVDVRSQAEALADLLPGVVPGARDPVPHGLARREPTAYLELLARRGAVAALRAPGGPGDFAWAVATRGQQDARSVGWGG